MKQTMMISFIILEMIQLEKNFNDFDNGIELFIKIQSHEMKLEDAKELQNIFISNLNKISKGRFESKQLKTCIRKYEIALQTTTSCY